MKRSKFSEAQVAFILKQAEEGAPIAEVCRKAGTLTSPGTATRPPFANGCRKLRRRASATDIDASMCCCGVKAGR